MIFVDYGVSKNCKNLSQSYGEICVKCGKCGRTFEDEELIKQILKARETKNKKDS